jgi:hypothetical protein
MLKPSSAESLYALVHDPRWRSAPPSEEDVLTLLATVNEGSRLLDGIVYCCQRKLVFRRVVMEHEPVLCYVDPDNGFDETTIKFPAVTLSIDAAAGAVSADWRIGSMRYFEADQHWVVTLRPGKDVSVGGQQLAEYGVGTHCSLPIAMTLASIGARLGKRHARELAVSAAVTGSAKPPARPISRAE